ncbi:MAG TPA: hypothetical protein VFX28_09235 [Methylomirabilota bacterium]|nr:hypothetical protein [Methylomirabilota bacterium]
MVGVRVMDARHARKPDPGFGDPETAMHELRRLGRQAEHAVDRARRLHEAAAADPALERRATLADARVAMLSARMVAVRRALARAMALQASGRDPRLPL